MDRDDAKQEWVRFALLVCEGPRPGPVGVGVGAPFVR